MRITCIHQGCELYGSDRSFIESVEAVRLAFPAAVVDVVLPGDGPIVPHLRPFASTVSFEPLWILRRADLPRLATLGLLRLPRALARAARRISASDLVYINTSVVVDYALAARLFKGRVLTHVHEIPAGLTMKALRALLRLSRAELIFNSHATRHAYAMPPAVRSHVIYNGIEGPARAEPVTYDGARPLRLLMLGRINRIKGQEILVEAAAGLPEALRARLEIRIVGSAFQDDAREAALRALIGARGLGKSVSLAPFTPDPSGHYRWADIVAVPSRLPESLGRVAIEAMAYGRPPLVSAIGGLREIVEDGVTGWQVPPGQAGPLGARLAEIIAHPEGWRGYGAAARARFEDMFGKAPAAAAIAEVLHAALQRRSRRGKQTGETALIRDGA